MTEATFIAIVLFIGFVFSGVVYLARAQGKLLSDALPAWALPILIEALKAGKEAAKQTPTLTDDELFQRMIDELEKRGLVVVQLEPPSGSVELPKIDPNALR